MRDKPAVNRALEILRNAPDDDTVCVGRTACIDFSGGEDGEFEVGFQGVREGELLVVVVGVGVFVSACGRGRKRG